MKYLMILLVVLPACSSNPGNTRVERIHNLLTDKFENREFTGSVLVAGKEGIIYRGSFGYADVEKHERNTDSTKFLIASLSKPITSILMLRLVDKGFINLDDPIKKYFHVTNAKVGAITLHQLMTHTSGISEFIGKNMGTEIGSLLDSVSLHFEPGTDFEYSNSGYVLLKEVAQLSTGRSFSDLLNEEVFKVTGMTSSGVARNSMLHQLATGYRDATQSEKESVDFPLENIDGAGSVYSTTADLSLLDIALYDTVLLSNEMKDKMLKQQVAEKYGYGWFIRERSGHWSVYWQKGNLPGHSTYISRNIRGHQLIVILSNSGQVEVDEIEQDIYRIIK